MIINKLFIFKILFYFSIFFIVFINAIQIFDPILVQHGFRQTQTALSAYYIFQDGFKLAYETPNFGEPWSVPMEFPIYQIIVAWLTKFSNLSLTANGKIISLFFGIFSCVPIYFSLAKLKIDKASIYLCLFLVLSAPTYIYWSGTFMIETTAFFLTCCFILYFVKIFLGDWKTINFLLLGIFLSLALLQKITTAVPPLLFFSIILFFQAIKKNYFFEQKSYLIKLSLCILIPLFIGLSWVLYSDFLKELNPVGNGMTSYALSEFNYGTISHRLSAQLWAGSIMEGTVIPNSGILLGFVSVIFLIFKEKNYFRKNFVISNCILFILPFLIFTWLHISHKYYQVANLAFWAVASGVSTVFMFEFFKIKKVYFFSLIFFLFASNYSFFMHKYYFHPKSQLNESHYRTLDLGNFINEMTPQDQPIVVYGYEAGSQLAFYSKRKALSVTDLATGEEVVTNPEKFFSSLPSTFVLCPFIYKDKEIDYYNSRKIEILIKENFNVVEQNFLDCKIFFTEN